MGRDPHARAWRANNDRRRRPADGFRVRDRVRFAQLVEDVLVTLPDVLLDAARDAEVRIDDVPAVGRASAGAAPDVPLAVFVPAASRRPPVLTVYRRPLEARAASRGDLLEVLRLAIGHEIARVLGIDDALDDLDDDW